MFPCFNPRAHGGRDIHARYRTFRTRFQSTRPRGARPKIPYNATQVIVSIHAPTGGATSISNRCNGKDCFNPRAHGGRDAVDAPLSIMLVFQSTRPRGARLCLGVQGGQMTVSIHAPTGGATNNYRYSDRNNCFNPRAHGGRDLNTSRLCGLNLFQSTRPRGARPGAHGCRVLYTVSIHAPTGGATK